ncbi:tumor necrosis factor receptor superfamily member wengen [Scaptodrosophila lebanonensis]|uniref:Tumor necrosis factor receptor superfamily member wengen n=1 Tax=Drosophila lebanonensis TaxID=7225 RepID=A0A6J2TW09_DROLE|nr:tumor necrosis factor receptor superfamily member wengen [Scaptodrosophila lebanonensis]
MQKRRAEKRAKKSETNKQQNNAAATAATTTKLTTNSSSNNFINNNNLTLIATTLNAPMEAHFYTTRSKRRRRRSQILNVADDHTELATETSIPTPTPTAAATAATATTIAIPATSPTTIAARSATARCSQPTLLQNAFHTFNILSSRCCSRATAYMALLLLSTTACSLCASASSPCEPNHWWDPVQDKCMPCTQCQGEMIPLRPCQLHRDTICGSIYDLNIDWVVLAKTEPNWKERRKSEYEHFEHDSVPLQHLTHEQLQQLHEEAAALPLDWQTGLLFMAVLACLLFFSVAACILIHHMRQWRRMERRLDQDVEELSTKLMAKLAEVQSLEGGTFFIGNADALRGMSATTASAVATHTAASSAIFQPQHVLLPDKHGKNHHERRILKTLQPGNVYIEENGSSKG